jgi:hypothetical protein
MRWAGHVARMGENRNAYRLFVGKPGGKRPLGRPRRRWVDNIRLDLGEVGWSDVDWIGLAQDRNRWRALGSLKCWQTIEWSAPQLLWLLRDAVSARTNTDWSSPSLKTLAVTNLLHDVLTVGHVLQRKPTHKSHAYKTLFMYR